MGIDAATATASAVDTMTATAAVVRTAICHGLIIVDCDTARDSCRRALAFLVTYKSGLPRELFKNKFAALVGGTRKELG